MRGDELAQENWKKIVFNSEKIVRSMKITVSPFAINGIPAFLVAYSRTCDFRGVGAHFLMENGAKKVTNIFVICLEKILSLDYHKSLCLPGNWSKPVHKLILHENQLELVSRS